MFGSFVPTISSRSQLCLVSACLTPTPHSLGTYSQGLHLQTLHGVAALEAVVARLRGPGLCSATVFVAFADENHPVRSETRIHEFARARHREHDHEVGKRVLLVDLYKCPYPYVVGKTAPWELQFHADAVHL